MSGKNLVLQLWPKMLLTNQIEVLFSILLGFLHGDSHQVKVASETTIFGLV